MVGMKMVKKKVQAITLGDQEWEYGNSGTKMAKRRKTLFIKNDKEINRKEFTTP